MTFGLTPTIAPRSSIRRRAIWPATEQAALIWDQKVTMGVQTSWRYRLLSDETVYSVSQSNDHETDIRLADGSVKMDVTGNPEPRFWRGLVDARFGNMEQATTDLKFALAAEPENPSYRAASYIIGDHDGAQAWWAAEGKIGIAEATLDCGSGRKHADYGQTRVGSALLAECVAVTPDSVGGKAAKERLADLVGTLH